MSTQDSNTEQLHRGTFADGQANSDPHPDRRHVGTIADGEAHPEAHRGEHHLGTFAEGQAQPNAYADEDHEGTFAEGRGTITTKIPSIDYRCTRCGAQRTYQLVPLEARPTEAEVKAIPHEIPSIDLRCSRCGASRTYKLVPDSLLQADHHPANSRPVHDRSAMPSADRHTGSDVGEDPRDPTPADAREALLHDADASVAAKRGG